MRLERSFDGELDDVLVEQEEAALVDGVGDLGLDVHARVPARLGRVPLVAEADLAVLVVHLGHETEVGAKIGADVLERPPTTSRCGCCGCSRSPRPNRRMVPSGWSKSSTTSSGYRVLELRIWTETRSLDDEAEVAVDAGDPVEIVGAVTVGEDPAEGESVADVVLVAQHGGRVGFVRGR